MVTTIFDTGCTGSCTVTTCSCTTSSRHWSSTSVAVDLLRAWVVDFGDGSLTTDSKDTDYSVRAVRTAP